MYVAPPAPKPAPRLPLVPPKFNPPNLSVPRPRKKSRGVKPSPEDAIRRDPRVITLCNELSRGAGVVAATVAWDAVRAELAAGGAPPGTPGSARRGGTPPPAAAGVATPRSAGATPRRGAASPGAAAAAAARSPATPSPRSAAAAASAAAAEAEPEMSEEQAAAYAVTLPERAAAVAAFQPSSLQDVSDFVSDVRAQGGDAPRSGCAFLGAVDGPMGPGLCPGAAAPPCRWRAQAPACISPHLTQRSSHPPASPPPVRRHAGAGFPTARWRCMAEAAAAFDALLDGCDRLSKWECAPGVSARGAACCEGPTGHSPSRAGAAVPPA